MPKGKKKKTKKKRATRNDLPKELAEVKTAQLLTFKAENVLRLKAVALKMDKDTLVLEGENEQGKSSVIESMAMLMAGGQMPQKVLREGADKGIIVAEYQTDAGKLIVNKTFTESKTPALKVTLEGRRGAFTAGQTILDVLLDHISLDPLQFARMDPKEQAETLATLMGFDPTPLNQRRKELYDERTDVNREVKRLCSAWQSIPKHDDAPEQEVSVSDLMATLEERQHHNAEGESAEERIAEISGELSQNASRLAALKEEIALLEAKATQLASERKTAIAKIADFEHQDTNEIKKQISQADEINAAVRDNKMRAKAYEDYMAKHSEWERLNDDIDAIDRKKAQAFKEARENLPVPDLDITEDGITYKGSPFAQAGTSATLKVSAAISMALNKDSAVKLLMIDDAEQMDAKSTQMLCEMAGERGFKVFLARVLGAAGKSEGSVIIEDGVAEG